MFRGTTSLTSAYRGDTALSAIYRGSTLLWSSASVGYLSHLAVLSASHSSTATVNHSMSVPTGALSALVFTNHAGATTGDATSTPTVSFNNGAASGVQLTGSTSSISSQSGRVRMDVFVCPCNDGGTSFSYSSGNSVAAGATAYFFDQLYTISDFTVAEESYKNSVPSAVAVYPVGPTLSSLGAAAFGQVVASRESEYLNANLDATDWVDDLLGRTTGSTVNSDYLYRGLHTLNTSADLTPRVDLNKTSTSGASYNSHIFVTKD